MSDDIESLKEAEKENEYSYEYKEETAEKTHEWCGTGNWIPGVILIALGMIFLFTNLTNFHLDNWWALFIMIPAVKNFGSAWSSYQRHGRFTKSARGSITGGLILTLLASAFLFNISWGLVWPFFLIIGGVAALFNGWFD